MASIKIENLKRSEALAMLSNFQANHAKSYAIQGKQTNRYINTDVILVTVKPQEDWQCQPDFSKNTFEIQSNYYQKSSLQGFLK